MTVSFSVEPADAVVTVINGDTRIPVENGACSLQLGTYTVEVTSELCETLTEEVTVTLNRNTHNYTYALTYLGADYTAVDAAIAKAEALNPDDYTDFSAVEAAVSAVVRGKKITEQEEVDAMAQAIEDAIANLEKKPATAPSEPEQPSGPSGTEESPADPTQGQPGTGTTDTPKTGDSSNLVRWIVILLAAGAALTGTILYSNKKKSSR